MANRETLVFTIVLAMSCVRGGIGLNAQSPAGGSPGDGSTPVAVETAPASRGDVAPLPQAPEAAPDPTGEPAAEPVEATASGADPASPTVPAPVPSDPVPSDSGVEPEVEAQTAEPGKRGGQGLKGILNLFTGQSPNAEKPGEDGQKQVNEETQKRVNEMARLAITNIEKGRISESIRNINDLITLKPYDANYHLALGLCYRREGKYKEALKKYQDVLDLGGPKALVAVLKAESCAAVGQLDKVFGLLREAALGGRNVILDVRTLPVLSKYQQDTEFIKLALQLEKFSVSRPKHDPFTNPFPKPNADGAGEDVSREGITALVPEEQEKLLIDARKLYERVKFYIKLEDETKAMKAYTSLRDLVRQKDLLTIPKIVNDFRVLVSQLEGLEIEIEGIRLRYFYNQAKTKLNQMRETFADGEYQKVESLHGEVVKLTQEMQQANNSYKPVAEQVLAASTRWLTRAQVRREFQAKKPLIQGIVVSPEGKMALLNQTMVKQGESFEDFRVVKVESNKVTFRYKGEEIPLVLRRY